MTESPVATAKAHVMLYDADASTWVSSGPRPGVAKVQLYHNTATNAYRIVGWRLQDREVVLNCAIVRGLKYQCARRTFHQWRDSKQVYGLNFTSGEEADEFAAAIESALGHLAALHQHQQAPPSPSPQQQQLQQQAQCIVPVNNRPPTKPPPNSQPGNYPYEGTNHYDSSQEQPRPPQSVTRVVTGAYVDMSQASIIPPASRPCTTPNLGRQNSVTAEYAYPGHTTVDAKRPGSVDPGYSRTDYASGPTVNGTVANGNGGTYAPPKDSRYYSSSDDSVKGLMGARDNGNAPNQIRNSPNEMCNSANRCVSPSVNSVPNGPESAPTVPPVIPPPPPPLFPIESAGTTRASRPLHRSTVNAPTISDAGDDEDDVSGVNEGGLAAQLRMVKQQRLRASSVANVGTTESATVGRAGGLDMISDLQRVLAARRRAKEAEQEGDTTDSPAGDIPVSQSANTARLPATSTNANSSQQQSVSRTSSIVPGFTTLRKNSSPALDTNSLNFLSNTPGGGSGAATVENTVSRADLEAFKRELMAEFRREVQQLKNDVIEALRAATTNRCS